MRVVLTGSRKWRDAQMIRKVLRGILDFTGPYTLVHGQARGADIIGDHMARQLGLEVDAHAADWKGNGKAAGLIRNQQMLNAGCDLVVAFKDDFDHELKHGGTEHMVKIARKAGIPCRVYSHSAIVMY